MNKTIKLLCTWAAGLLLAGCSSEADMEKLMDWQSNPDAVHFTASVNNATTRTNPAATDATQTKFNENDQVTVSNNGNQADYAYKEKSWAPAIADKYLLWDRSNLTFNCWYPADGNNTATIGYLTADQSSAELMAKSDYMNAEKTLKTSDEALNFSLERKTARLVLKISGLIDVSETIKHVRIVSKASTAADETQTIDITPLTSGGGGIGTTYTALVAPGEVVAKFYFTDNTSTEEPVTMTTNVTAAGNSYIYNLIVGKKKIKVTGIKAGPWTASGTTTGDLICYPYVTFTAKDSQTFKMTKPGYNRFEYSVNNGKWATVKAGTEVTFGGANGTLRLRGTSINGTASSSFDGEYSTITFTDKKVKVACTGDIRTLQDWRNYSTVNTQKARFCSLFKDCAVLTSAPDLPATTLADDCYFKMFRGCTSLTSAPELKATKLADQCYFAMFFGCTSLTSAPELKATTLANNCYQYMFSGCTSLTSAPELKATTLANNCYQYMFSGCTSLTSAPELKATTLANNCYQYMFSGCTSLTSAPELKATTLVGSCYESMFSGCTSLEKAPELKATTLANYCYDSMFNGCTKLSSVTMLAPSDQISKATNCCYNWLYNAGTDPTVKSRTLIVTDEAAYNALVRKTIYLPAIWKKDAAGTTVQYGNKNEIK